MNSWQKTNEVWFGDTFARSSVTACCNAELAYDSAIGGDTTCITGKEIKWDDNNSIAFACSNQAALDGLCSYDNLYMATKADVDTVSDRLHSLQAQIDDLKKKLETKKENSELRSALKTLHYKREVE